MKNGAATAAAPARETSTAPKSPASRGAGSVIQRKCACGSHSGGGECAQCQERKRRVQRKRGLAREHQNEFESVERTLDEPGSTLDSGTRSFFESRFRQDFSSVRVHTGPGADASADSLGAQAYTSGSHIVFGSGRYSPHTDAGRALLAHELTHVVQQRIKPRTAALDTPGEPAELEADRNAGNLVTSAPVTFASPSAAVARQEAPTVEVQGPAGPPACGMNEHRAIEPAVRTALDWLGRAIQRVDAFIGQPAAPANAGTRAAFQRHFHAADAALAGRVRARLDQIRTDITTRNPFTVECHSSADTTCGVAEAYVPGTNQSMVVFCPSFFSDTPDGRASTLVHEMAHTQLGGPDIEDRAYSSNRLYPLLTTAEAETNAESYALFAEELGAGRVPELTAPQDQISDACGGQVTPLVREALARAERWNRDAEVVVGDTRNLDSDLLTQHLGNATAATRSAAVQHYRNGESQFRRSIDVQCDTRNCGTRTAYGTKGVDRSGAGAGIGAAIGGLLGGVVGALAGAGAGLALAGGLLGGGLGLLVGLLIGAGIGSAVSSSPKIMICPGWRALAAPARTEAVLDAFYEGFQEVAPPASTRYAALARAVHERHF